MQSWVFLECFVQTFCFDGKPLGKVGSNPPLGKGRVKNLREGDQNDSE